RRWMRICAITGSTGCREPGSRCGRHCAARAARVASARTGQRDRRADCRLEHGERICSRQRPASIGIADAGSSGALVSAHRILEHRERVGRLHRAVAVGIAANEGRNTIGNRGVLAADLDGDALVGGAAVVVIAIERRTRDAGARSIAGRWAGARVDVVARAAVRIRTVARVELLVAGLGAVVVVVGPGAWRALMHAAASARACVGSVAEDPVIARAAVRVGVSAAARAVAARLRAVGVAVVPGARVAGMLAARRAGIAGVRAVASEAVVARGAGRLLVTGRRAAVSAGEITVVAVFAQLFLAVAALDLDELHVEEVAVEFGTAVGAHADLIRTGLGDVVDELRTQRDARVVVEGNARQVVAVDAVALAGRSRTAKL